MLSTKYVENFLEHHDKVGDLNQVVKRIVEIETELGVEVLDWNEAEQIEYLKSFNALSPISLNKYSVVLRKFADYICKKENLPKREYLLETTTFEQLIDRKQLLNLSLSYEQYVEIKNQLTIIENGKELNTRDKLIFELAWSGLTNEEIKLLREDAIEFDTNDYEQEIAILNLNTDRIVRIEDPEIVQDIKSCMEEKTYTVKAKDGRIKTMSYRFSEYLIKPVNVGRMKKEAYVDNPAVTLQNLFRNNQISCEGIDVYNVSLEDIRRSKILYLLAPENKEYFDDETILGLFNLRNKNSLTWLKDVAYEKYKND